MRHRVGDWEGDTVEGCKGSGGIATHVERSSRYLIAAHLTDKTAHVFTTQSIKAFKVIPRAFRHTLTLDNGKENARFQTIEKKTGLTVYFADPYSSWQRGLNENTNGLLRQYFPKEALNKALFHLIRVCGSRGQQKVGAARGLLQLLKTASAHMGKTPYEQLKQRILG